MQKVSSGSVRNEEETSRDGQDEEDQEINQ
jgi:hypothetical protein